jgi:ABC-type multidrug transport system permease subunit
LLTFFLTYNAFGGLAYILGAAIANKQVINIIMPVILVPTMLFAGFFVNQNNIPWFLLPIKYISIFKYSYQAYFLNEFEGL